MASLISNCLAKLVAAKKISQKAADSALALHEGIGKRLYPDMGPASADAAAALEAARVMADSAKRSCIVAESTAALYSGREDESCQDS